MMKRFREISMGLFAILALAYSLLAAPAPYAAAETVITDEAYLFSDEQIRELTEQSDLIYDHHQVDIYIMTRNSLPNDQYFITYMEDYADAMEVTDAILLLINMDPSNRVYEIEGYGIAETYLNESRCGNILDSMHSDMVAGNYFDAVMTALDKSNKYLKAKNSILGDLVIDNPFFSAGASLIFACLFGGLIVASWVYRSGGKMTVGSLTYMNQNSSRVLARHDHYIRTTTTRHRKPENTGGGGGGRSGSGVSSGGRSHSGGGGRSF